jgi:hypothetical protein
MDIYLMFLMINLILEINNLLWVEDEKVSYKDA